MRVVGIDLSLASTGVCVVNHGIIRTSKIKSKGAREAPYIERAVRLASISMQLVAAVAPHPDLVVIEGPSYGQTNAGSAHDRSGLWWLVVSELATQAIPTAVCPPTSRAKYATGKGNAGKDEVLAAVVRRYPDVPVKGNDEADALIMAAMGARYLGEPIDELPETHAGAMSGVAWPS